MAFKEFSGELDAAPQLKEFSGELDKPEPTLKDRIYKVANNLFGRGSVMDEFNPSSAVSANPVMADMAQQSAGRVFSKNAAAQTPTLQASNAKIVSGIPGIIEVGARKGYAGLGRIEAGTIKAIADTFDSDTLHAIADGQTRYADQVENGAILRKDMIKGFSGDSIVQDAPQAASSMIGSVIQTAPTLAAGAINPAAALPILFGTTAMQEYGEGRQSGLNPAGAGIRAIPMAAMEVIGEKLGGFDKIAKGLNAATRGNGVAGLGSAMASSAIKEIPGEEVTTTGQFLTDKLPGVGLNQEATVDDFKKAVKDTALATLLQSGAMGIGGKALQSVGGSAPAAAPQPQAVPENPVADQKAKADALATATNLASLIKNTATQDSKLNPATTPKMVEAPDDIKLDPAPSIDPAAPQVNPLAPSVSQDTDKILQNRNRATPSSIAQMTSIAANPDYNRLSFSRDFANGAPVVSGGIIPESQLGVSDIAVASDGRRIPIQYAVVDASELLPSNTADGSINEAYGDNQIDAVRAIAGNGRVAGLQEAYIKETAGTYRDELAADTLHGVDAKVIAGMANPVLVRVMPQESVTADIGDVSNTVGNLELSPVEQANNDVQRVNLEALEFAEDGAVTPKAIRQFVQAMPQAEQGSLLDTNGQPTKQAADRLNAAIFAKAYANDDLIRLYAQAQDPEARIVLSALAQVAPKMARLEGAGALDIRQAVTDAAEIAVNARRSGLSITRAAHQVDMTADANVVDVLSLFAANTRSSKAIAEALGRAADFAYSEAIKPEEGLFGVVPKASRQEVFDRLGNANEATSQENMELAQGGKSVQEDAARGGYQRPGQADAQGAEAGRPAADTNLRERTEGYGLESYTNRDIIERLDRIEKTQKEAAELARAEEAKRQADVERDQFGLTGSESPVDRLEAQGQGRLFQPIDEYVTDQTIKADVERAYGGRAAYDAALASGKTELSYEQWLRVRLPAFKRAFGNWEAVHAQKQLDAMQPVAVRIPDAWRGLSHVELRTKMAEALDRMVRDGVTITHPEIGDVRIGREGAKKSGQTARDPAKSLLAADIESVLPKAIYARSDPSRGGDGKDVDGYSTLFAKVSVDGVQMVAAFTVRKQSDGQWYYNAVTLHDTKDKAQDSYGRPDQQKVGSSVAPIAGLSEFIRRTLKRVNPDSLKGEINPRTGEPANPESFTIPVINQSDTYVKQRDLFLDYGPDESQAGADGEAAQREAVSAVDDLRSSGSVLGRALSSDYAARQRVTLVGQRVDSAEDLATLAQVYRDPRFETFRLIFVNDAGRVLSQIGLTSRLPASTQVIVGDDADSYLAEVSKIAKQRGATRYWMLHNHPSGIAAPSNADLNLTRYFSEKVPGLTNNGHVVIDTNQYGIIDAFGDYTVELKDFGAVEPMTAGEFSGLRIHSSSDAMRIAKQIDVDVGAVTIIGLDAQMRVQRITSAPSSAFGDDKNANHRILLKEALAGNHARLIVVGRDMEVLERAGRMATDAIWIDSDGNPISLAHRGSVGHPGLRPATRRTRVSPDTSPEFSYLRNANKATAEMIKRQNAVGESGSGTTTDTAGIRGEGDTARSTAAPDMVARESSLGYNENPQELMNVPPPGHKFEPLRASDFNPFKPERSSNGQRQYVAGRKLWDRLDAYAGEYLGKLKLADTKPGAFKEMLRQFNVDKTKASQQAKRIAETGMSLTPEQRELISDIVEKQAKVGDAAPEEIANLASTMVAALDVQSRELVDLGMLSEERLVKNYLPRLYKSGLSGMLTNPTLMRSWFTKARMRIRGDRLHSRGMFAEIDSGKVEQAKRLGWKVSSMPGGDPVPGDLIAAIDAGSDIPGQYRDSKVLMWRDYTESERQQMGEVRDGVLRYALGYVETQKDIAIGRLFKAIANNPDLAKAHNPGGWVKVPDQEISGAPGTKAYGALSGMWVEPQVADSLKRNTQPKGMLMAAYDRALSFWKEGKTVWNPVSHGNNVVSNLFTIYFAGLNPANPKLWRETLREYRVKGEFYTEALDNGLFGNEWANNEIQDLLMPDFADMADMESVAASRVAKMVEFAKKTGKPVSWYRENMQKAYEFEDQFFKLMLYIDRRKAGMSPQSAITDAERYVFNYADMPEGVELIKRTVSPFFAYTYKAIPMVLHTAMTRPDRMLAPIMLLGGANWLAYMLLGADEEEERKGMPEYMKGRTAIGTQKSVRLPFNIGDQPAFLDMSRRVPLGDLFDINNQTNGMPLPAPFMPSHPVLTMLQAVLYNQDTFTGRDLVKQSDTSWEAARARAGYMYRQFAPNAPFIPGSYNFNKLMDATANTFDTEIGPYTGRTKSGDPIRMGTVLPDVLTGTKIRAVDPQRGMAYQNASLDKEAQEIRANIKAAGRNKSMSDSSRQAYIEEQTDKLRLLGEKRSDLNQ